MKSGDEVFNIVMSVEGITLRRFSTRNLFGSGKPKADVMLEGPLGQQSPHILRLSLEGVDPEEFAIGTEFMLRMSAK